MFVKSLSPYTNNRFEFPSIRLLLLYGVYQTGALPPPEDNSRYATKYKAVITKHYSFALFSGSFKSFGCLHDKDLIDALEKGHPFNRFFYLCRRFLYEALFDCWVLTHLPDHVHLFI